MIDRDTITEMYSSECIEKITVTTDTEARRAAKSFVQSKEFVWARFHDYNNTRDLLEEQSRQVKLNHLAQFYYKDGILLYFNLPLTFTETHEEIG